MEKAKQNDTVRVHYTGKTETGGVFDTSVSGDPFEFTIGEGKLIKAFEKGVLGMSVKEKKTINIAADDAYGQHRAEMVNEIDRNILPDDITPTEGMKLVSHQGDTKINVKIVKVTDKTVTIDANHQLAGKDLVFDIELVEIL